MSLELHSNDCSLEAKPGIGLFHGRSVVFLVIGVAAFIVLFRQLSNLEVDWFISIPLALLPLLAMTLVVCFLINGRPKSYASDLLYLYIWKLRSHLYLNGCLDKAPTIWIPANKPRHPAEF